ncbi:1-acyl-sn-glycerol-3-phosphate acyltransferase [Blattabacterium sp. (Cryptocercus kyebangensis)]|uniref:lysophospholipid acyltransferase family protein n=1 Tax=Blattabacterium sp. (Cryptocercus kyebangensis) TaxID=298656 RepID=UPI000D7CCDA3|nr:lysophospholipid acyltransferase family protein [Blattabacterium sp. (Cryptocercus kyebangensis)]AWU43885.1 1-acyl-sn-glycerol-3-phosphate acyltransferase [Blattabacterium sp. (Cryptocercus kyebangensis)]
MKVIQASLILLWRVWFFLINIFLIPLLAGASIPFLFKDKYYYIAYWFHQIWARSNLFLMGFWYVLEKDKEILDKKKQYMIISNHSSIMDIMLIYSLMRNHPLVFVGKEELAKLPFFGFVYKRSNILINRKNLSSCMQVFKQIQKKIDSGKSVCLFPEGGVPHPSILLDHFKSGAFYIAIIKKIEIIPFTIADIKTKFPRSPIKGGPGKIRIKQHHSILTKNLSLKEKNFLKEKCFNLIQFQLEKFEREKNKPINS